MKAADSGMSRVRNIRRVRWARLLVLTFAQTRASARGDYRCLKGSAHVVCASAAGYAQAMVCLDFDGPLSPHPSLSLSRSSAMRSISAIAVENSASGVLASRARKASRISSLLRPFTAMMKGKPKRAL